MGYISDRRLVACASLLRLIAYTSGRDAVHPLDCLLLRHCLPHHDADNPGAADRVTDQIVSYCAVPASALKDLRQGTELQKCILRHLVHSTASKRSPAHGSSRDWRQRPVGVLAAAVGPSPANSASDLDSSVVLAVLLSILPRRLLPRKSGLVPRGLAQAHRGQWNPVQLGPWSSLLGAWM